MKNIEKFKDAVLTSDICCKMDSYVRGLLGIKLYDGPFCKLGDCTKCRERCFKWLMEECKEPILDDVERKYLSSLLKPFKSDVVSINKIKIGKCKAFLFIKVNGYNSFYLPSFESGKMYRNMELNKEYTLEELGL